MGLHFCPKPEEQFNNHFLLGYTICISLIYLIMMVIWLRNRKNFPIKERSPWLTFFAAVCALLSSILHPLTFLYMSYTNQLDKLDEDLDFLSFLSSLYKSLQELFVWPFIFRTMRLVYVFNVKFPLRRQFLDKLFSRESYLIFGCLIIFWLTFLITYFDPGDSDENNFVCSLVKTSYFSLSYNMFHYLIYIILAFLLRNITKEYNFQTEMLYFTFSCLIIDNFFVVCDYQQDIVGSKCVGALPIQHFILYLKNVFLVGIIMMYPVRFSSKVHFPLPPSIAKEDWKFLLVDERFFLVFYAYLERVQKHYEDLMALLDIKKNVNYTKKYATVYLRFYMDVNIANKRGSQGSIDLIIENYLKCCEHMQAFPASLLDQVFKKENLPSEVTNSNVEMFNNEESVFYESDGENKSTKNIVINRPRSISDLGELYTFTELQLKELYIDFSKTHSFRKIKLIVDAYDILNVRLFQYNLIRCE